MQWATYQKGSQKSQQPLADSLNPLAELSPAYWIKTSRLTLHKWRSLQKRAVWCTWQTPLTLDGVDIYTTPLSGTSTGGGCCHSSTPLSHFLSHSIINNPMPELCRNILVCCTTMWSTQSGANIYTMQQTSEHKKVSDQFANFELSRLNAQ